MAVAEDAGRASQTVADATHDLYRQYGRQIYAYCLHQLRSREEAEDAVQTTFLNAFRGLQRGTTTRFEQAWLYKIAQNVCIARRSSSGRRLRLESPDDFEVLQEVVPSSASTDGDTLELMGLDAALDSMPENQRRAILMREWQGMSYREIATELDLTQGAVEMLIFRARRTLANALEEPVAEKKRVNKMRDGVSVGSVVATMKSMLSTSVGLKMAAVAVSAAVVGTNGVVHSVITHVATPARKHMIARPTVHGRSVHTFAPAKTDVVETHRDAPKTPVPASSTAPVATKPIITTGVAESEPNPAQTTPAPMAAPELTPAPTPASEESATVASSPSTPAQTPVAQSPPPQTATTTDARGEKDGRGGQWRDMSDQWHQPATVTTSTTTTLTPTTPTTTWSWPGTTPAPVVSPVTVVPGGVATTPATGITATTNTTSTSTTTTTTTATSTLPSAPVVTQPAPSQLWDPPPTTPSRGDGGARDGWENAGGGGHGHP
jgi:RNA polymerase sigma-70 factor, ECF subfamily